MHYSTAALFISSLLAVASAAPSPERLTRRNYGGGYHPHHGQHGSYGHGSYGHGGHEQHHPSYRTKDYYHPHANSYHNYYPYITAKPQFTHAYERQQEYDSAISASENENENENENLAGAKSENANENANLAKGGEAFGFGALESDNRNLLANENNIEVANANKNELGVEVANFNANENTAQQESAALAEVANEDMAYFEDYLENENANTNDNQNDIYDSRGRQHYVASGNGAATGRPRGYCGNCGGSHGY